MKKQKHIIEGVTKRVVNKIVDVEVYGWPPQCGTIYYQPVRPSRGARQRIEGEKRVRHFKVF